MKNTFLLPLAVLFLFPLFTSANIYTLPVDEIGDSDISFFAWFDHNDSVSTEKYYDGDDGTTRIYDDHHGVDFRTNGVEEKEIYAVADGVVRADGWQNPSDHSEGYGYRIYLYHDDSGQRTVYAHATTTADYVDVSDPVDRGDIIILSGNTGNSSGSHLHFGVYDCDCTTSTEQVDPFGWQATTTDPWPHNENPYLWTTDPPSFELASTVSNDITSDTAWRGNILVDGGLSVTSGDTLTIAPKTVVKFSTTTSGLTVNGTLKAVGSLTAPIYFTSSWDDSVGGDTNGDAGATSPAPGYWRRIIVGTTGSTTVAHAVMRYGGYANDFACGATGVIVCNDGGRLNLFNTDISNSDYGARMISGTTTIISSDIYTHYIGLLIDDGFTTVADNTIHDNAYGIYKESGGTLVLTGNTFTNNSTAAMYISYNLAPTFIHSLNTATGTGSRGFLVEGPITSDQTFSADGMPYIFPYGLTINSGKTLTIDPGAVLKFVNASDALTVSGTLDVRGSSTTPVYFTSLKDDLAGGDTNADDDDTSPSAGDWQQIIIGSTGSSTINGAVVRYGGDYSCCGGSGALINNNGGYLTVSDSRVSTSSAHGILLNAGTTTMASTEVYNNPYGVTLVGGVSTILGSSVHDNSVNGMYSFLSATTTVENSYWGASSGPYHPALNPSGGGNAVTDYIDFDPWLTSWP